MRAEEQRIKSALEQANGKIPMAAVILGWTERRIRFAILKYPRLVPWLTEKPPVESALVDRDPPPGAGTELAPPAKAMLVESMSAEDRTFKAGLEELGLGPNEVKMVMALQGLTNRSFKSTFELIHGGMTKTFVNCLTERDRMRAIQDGLLAQIEGPNNLPEEKRLLIVTEIQAWSKRLRELDESIIRTNQVMHEGALAILAQRRPPPRRPGFGHGGGGGGGGPMKLE